MEQPQKVPGETLIVIVTYLTAQTLCIVVPGKVMAADVVNLTSADTAPGQPVTISVMDGKVMINEAQVVLTETGPWWPLLRCAGSTSHLA